MTDGMWDGYDPDADAPAVNPFDHNDQAELWEAWEKKQAAETAEARRAREAQILSRATGEQLLRMRARRAAETALAAEDAQIAVVPDSTRLTDLLAEDDNPAAYRIEGVWPAGGNIVLAAAYKAGKTTTTGNLLRSLADGDPFLGAFQVTAVTDGRVGIIDFEMARDRFKTWLRDQGIKHTDRITTWTLRGQAAAFNIVDPAIRALWAARLQADDVRVLIVDCLGPILSALGRDEDNKGVGPVLDALTALAHQAGVQEVLLVHHMGHAAERSRGASRLRDWPDAEWRIVRQRDPDNPAAEPAPNAPRFFSAFGRDVEVGEGQLAYDPHSRHLTWAEGSRREARTKGAQTAVLQFVHDNPGQSGRAIEAAIVGAGDTEHTRAAVRESLDGAVATKLINTRTGAHRAKLHHLTPAGLTRLHTLTGEANDWPTEPTPEEPPTPAEELTQCPSCFAPHDGPAATLCPKCEKRT